MTQINEEGLKHIQNIFGYNDNDLELFKNNPRNIELISRINEFENNLFILEVIESKGCHSNHQIGDKFYFDYAGNILTDLCPKKICGFSLNSALMMIFAASEMLYAGGDPNKMKFNRASCFDVGIECGGVGRIVLELKIEKK